MVTFRFRTPFNFYYKSLSVPYIVNPYCAYFRSTSMSSWTWWWRTRRPEQKQVLNNNFYINRYNCIFENLLGETQVIPTWSKNYHVIRFSSLRHIETNIFYEKFLCQIWDFLSILFSSLLHLPLCWRIETRVRRSSPKL